MAAALLFEAVCRAARAPEDPQGPALLALARSLHARDLTPSYGPGDHGNLSCRTSTGCLISASQTRKASLRADQLARVVEYTRTPDGARVTYEGCAQPSTDAAMHAELYRRRPDIAAIVHAHDNAVLARAQALGLPVTATSARTNSWALVDEVVALSARHDYIVLRDHGVVALGPSLDAADALLNATAARLH